MYYRCQLSEIQILHVTCNYGVPYIIFFQCQISKSCDRYSLSEPDIQEFSIETQDFTCSDSLPDLCCISVRTLHISSQISYIKPLPPNITYLTSDP